jgi:hypothetical protein
MKVRDRIRELRRVRAAELRPNPRNWRVHPAAQQNALRGILAEVGYADALLARELADGSLELVDGHLRAETTPDQLVPVLVLDVDESEADKIMLTHDPLAAMAVADAERLDALLQRVDTGSAELSAMLARLAGEAGCSQEQCNPPPVEIPTTFELVVECDDEPAQQALYSRLTAEGFRCRVLML